MAFTFYEYRHDRTDVTQLTELTDARASVAFMRAQRHTAPDTGLIVIIGGQLVIDCPPLVGTPSDLAHP